MMELVVPSAPLRESSSWRYWKGVLGGEEDCGAGKAKAFAARAERSAAES